MDETRLPRVCILQRYLPPDPSGAGKQAVTLARNLHGMGYEACLLGDRSASEPEPSPPDDVSVYWVEAPPPRPNRRDILAYWTRVIVALFRRRAQFDIVHIHAVSFFHAAAIPFARLFGKAVLVRASLEGDLPDPTRSRSEWIHYQCLRFADLFVVISRRLMKQYADARIPRAKLKRIPNGVDTDRYTPLAGSLQPALRRELGLPENAKILTYHGVFVERKSIRWALPLIEEHLIGTDLVLLLIGSPGRDEAETGYYERLKERISQSPARDSIILTGFKKDVHRYLQASDLYFLPSTGEGLPNALLEAMAVGLLPIVSRTSGSDEVIEHGVSGYLFEPRDEEDFLRCLDKAVSAADSDRAEQMTRAAVERVRSDYSIGSVVEQYAEAYRELHRSKRRKRFR